MSTPLGDEIDRLKAENENLREILKSHQKFAKLESKLYSFDCNCINLNPDYEKLYETGNCPHQLTRAALGDNN